MNPIRANELSRKQVITNIGTLFSGTAVARVLSALAFFLIARQLGPDNFGLFISSISLVKLWSVLFSLGLDSWLLRNGHSNELPLSLTSGACLSIKIGLGGVWVIGFVMVAPILQQSIFPQDLIILAALSVWLDEIANVAWSTFKSTLHNRIAAGLIVTSQSLLLLLTLALIFLGRGTVQTFLGIRLAASFVSMTISVLLVVRLVGFQLNFGIVVYVLRDTLSFAASHGLAVVYERADITIIGIFLGKTAAGLYGPAVSLMTTLFLIPQAIYEVMLAWMSQVFVQNPNSIARRTFQLVLASTILGIGLGIGLAVMAYPLVWVIYGPAYAASGGILVILSTILILKSISFALASVITAIGWQSRRVVVQLVTASSNIILNIIFIQSYGLNGVAYVYIISESVLMLGYMAYLLKWQKGFRRLEN